MSKEIIISLSEDAKKVYTELNKIVNEEINKGVASSFHQTLLRSIRRARELLEKEPFVGNQIPRSLIPKKYIKQ